MSTIKNRVRLALAGRALTRVEVAKAAGITLDQAESAIKHLRKTGDLRSASPGMYELITDPSVPLPNVSMMQHALMHSPVSVFAMGARA